MKRIVVALVLVFSSVVSLTGNAQSVRSELIFTTPDKLPKNVNTDSTEVFLLFSRDSSNLFFVRQGDRHNEGFKDNPYDQDIWVVTRNQDSSYSESRNFRKFNNKENNGVVGMSLDGNTIYLLNAYLKKKNTFEKGIAVSHKKGNGWSDPVKLEIPGLKIEGEFYGFYVNPQETAIIISYNGPGSMGEEDLYVCLKQADGTWGKPTSLGTKVNSAGFEMSPYLSEDGYTLFWSTNGRGGEGDADIFASFRTDDSWTSWSEPVNMGAPINSKGFDAYFIMSQNDAWFASDRESHGHCDIYHCHAVEPKIEEVVEHIDTVVADPTPVIREINVSEVFDATDKQLEDIIPKLPLYVEVKLFFATNSSFIEPDAKQVVDSVIKLMKKFPTVVAEIHSHADKRASESYNQWLTQRRAERVVNYMVLMGVDQKKLTANWYGKKKLAVQCDVCTEEQLRASRRTVIKLSRIE